MVTMKDIAMLVGVSRQAVSSALNGNSSCRISEAKRKEIKRVARELNYVSNAAALSLKGAPSKTIGIMGPIFSSELNVALISEISQMLIAESYNILYNDFTYSNFCATESLLNLVARGVDGIIICGSEDTGTLEANQTVPYLFYSHNNYRYMDVGVDNKHGGYLAVKHLLDHGHEKVHYMVILPYEKNNAKHQGWRLAHEEAGIATSGKDIIVLQKLDGNADAAVEQLKRRKATAVYASNDFIGIRLIKILTQRGIRVPEDIAVVGYDGYAFCRATTPSLTTIVQPIRPQAEFGVELLLARIKNKELHSAPANHLIEPVLYPGESCGCQSAEIKDFYRINSFAMIEKEAKVNFDMDILKPNQKEPRK